jgi:hypothetical protein
VFFDSTRYLDALEITGGGVDIAYGFLRVSGVGLQVFFWCTCSAEVEI